MAVATNRSPSLTVSDLRVELGRHAVIDGLGLDLRPGEVFGILGRSGSGKTTLLRTLAGLETAFHGRITVHGHDVTDRSPADRMMSFMHQSFALFEDLTVLENIRFGLSGRHESDEQIVETLIEELGLSELRHRPAARLSGGERQRLALARAIAPRRPILLLDEPLSQLDTSVRAQTRNQMLQVFRQHEMSVLFVSHDMHDCVDLCDRVGVLSQGRIVESGVPGDLYRTPVHLPTAMFTGNVNVLRLVGPPEPTGSNRAAARIEDGLQVRGPPPASECTYWGARPEAFAFEKRDGWRPLDYGTVLRIADGGSASSVFVRLSGGEVFRITRGVHMVEEEVDQRVQVYYDPASAFFLISEE